MAGSGSVGGGIDIHSFFKTAGTAPPTSLSTSSLSSFPPPPPPSTTPMAPAGTGYMAPQAYSAQVPSDYQSYSHYAPDSGASWAPPPSSQGVPYAGSFPGEGRPGGLSGNLNGAHLMSLLAPQPSLQHATQLLSSSVSHQGPPAAPLSAAEPQMEASTSSAGKSLADLLGNLSTSSSISSNSSVPPPALAPAVPSAPPVPPTLDARSPSQAFDHATQGSRSKAKGRPLSGRHVGYDIDVRLPGEEQPQLEVAPITVYASEYLLAPGRQIAVNRRYICYALKKAAIRILNVNTALRALLRGHSQRVTDMAFFGEDVHLLAIASSDGRVSARRLSEQVGEEGKPQIHEEPLFTLQLQGPWGSDPVSPQVCWHPTSQDTLIVACQQYIFFVSASRVNRGGDMAGIDTPLPCSVDAPPPGIHVVAGHHGPVTLLKTWPSPLAYMPTPAQDGTVCIWDMNSYASSSSLVPHGGQPVYSAAFLLPPGNTYTTPVLLTGGPMNAELKLWASGSQDPKADWQCIQTLELQGKGGKDGGAFFNQIHVVQQAGLILLANARKQAIYAIHVRFGSQPHDARMEYLAEFAVTMPILSFTALMEPGAEPPGRVQIYCVQTSAIQLYTLELAACQPPEEEQTSAATVRGDEGSAPDSLEVFQASPERLPPELPPAVSALAKASSSGGFGSPVEAPHPVRKPIADHAATELSEASVSQPADVAATEADSSAPEEPPVATRGDETEESRGGPEPILEAASGEGAAVSKQIPTSAEVSISLPEPVASSPSTPPAPALLPSEDSGSLGATVSEPSVTSEASRVDESKPEEATAANHVTLLTPAHLMSLVNSSQGEPSSVAPAPSGTDLLEKPSGDKAPGEKDITEEKPEAMDAKIPAMEVSAEAPTSSAVETAQPEPEAPASGGKIPAVSEAAVSKVDKAAASVQSKDSSAAVRQSPTPQVASETESPFTLAESGVGQPEQALPGGAVPKALDATSSTATSLSPSTSLPAAPTLAPSPVSSKGRKNKNKATASVSTASPPLPMQAPPASSTTAVLPPAVLGVPEADAGPAGPAGPSNGAAAAPSAAVQESLNQLLGLQRELGGKLAMLVAVPMAKEGKRIEAALGTRMEKVLKAHADAQWARLQEDAARREKAERERLQQTNGATVAALAKELQPSLERLVKKEVSQLAPLVVRQLAPALEASLGSVTADALQKLSSQVESTLASQVEASVSRHVASQIQATVRASMQEALRLCFEATVIPAFESACRGMFEQMDASLQRGLGEHSSAVQQQMAAAHTPLAGSLQESMAAASALVGQLRDEAVEGQRKLVAAAEKAAASGAALGQGAGTTGTKPNGLPERVLSVQHVEEALDPTRELARMVAEHHYEDAFTRALSLSDVAIVSWLCSQVDPAVVFASGSVKLSEGVLLSLVQQLGCDLARETERKLLWLRNAVLVLNPLHPQLAPHMRPILQQLYQNLHRQLPLCSDAVAAEMRLVIHVVNSLLTSCK